ncbi:MAG: hypothetical protein ACRCX1_10410 [Bacteroidales bacterium]
MDAVANGCRWLQMKFDLQRVISCNIGVYTHVANVANVADKTLSILNLLT